MDQSKSNESWTGIAIGFIAGSILTPTIAYYFSNSEKSGVTVGFITGSVFAVAVVRSFFDSSNDDNASLRRNLIRRTSLRGSTQLSAKNFTDVVANDQHINFLSDIISRLWGHLNIALSEKIREAVEPTLKGMGMHFTKVDMGSTPIILDNIVVDELKAGGKQCTFNMDVVWTGNCNIKIKHNTLPSFGIANITLEGRMQFVMKPLTDVIPCVEAVQFAFINPPKFDLDFTGIVAIANANAITNKIVNVVEESLTSMMVLPNRMLIKLDPFCKILNAYTPPLGVARITAVNGGDFANINKTFGKDDIPDIYLEISLGDRKCKTKTIVDCVDPRWDESMDFVLSGYDQKLNIKAYDAKDSLLDTNHVVGVAEIAAGELILSGGKKNVRVPLQVKYVNTGAYIALNFELCPLISSPESYENPLKSSNDLGGLMTIIVIQAHKLPIPKEEAATFVNVTCGMKKFTTGVVAYVPEYDGLPGCDVLNPFYDTIFEVPLDLEMLMKKIPSVVFELVNGEKQILGKLEVPYTEFIASPNATTIESRRIGDAGAHLDFHITINGIKPASVIKSSAVFEQAKPGIRSTEEAKIDSPQNVRTINSQPTLVDENADTSKLHITMVSGQGFKTTKKRFVKDIPDVYCVVKFGSSPKTWRTSTIKNNELPIWNESNDYTFSNHNQVINVEVFDENSNGKDDFYGSFRVTVGQVLLDGGMREVEISRDGKLTGLFINVKCELD